MLYLRAKFQLQICCTSWDIIWRKKYYSWSVTQSAASCHLINCLTALFTTQLAQFDTVVLQLCWTVWTVVSSSSGILLFQQQVNDSHHLAGGSRRRRTAATATRHPRSSRRWPMAGGSWRRRTAATVARRLWSSHRWESCLGKIAEVVSCCLPRGFYFWVSFCWIVLSKTHPCRAPVRDSHAATELSWWSRNAAVPSNYSLLGSVPDDVIAAFLAETNMLPPCRHGDPGTPQCVGCLTVRLRGNIPHVESTNLL